MRHDVHINDSMSRLHQDNITLEIGDDMFVSRLLRDNICSDQKENLQIFDNYIYFQITVISFILFIQHYLMFCCVAQSA